MSNRECIEKELKDFPNGKLKLEIIALAIQFIEVEGYFVAEAIKEAKNITLANQ